MKFLEGSSRKPFSHKVSKQSCGWNVQNTEQAEGDFLPDEVYVELNVLRAVMMNWICFHVDTGDVVAEHGRGHRQRCMQFAEKLTQPAALGDGIGHGMVLRFGAGVGDCGLALG
jgi:hypothetical protein